MTRKASFATIATMRVYWSILALGLTLVPLSSARADAPPKATAAAPDARGGGDDEVTLKSGGMLRGTVVALEPQKQVVILVQGTGEQRTVPWAEVDKVERGKYAASTAPPEQKPKKASPPPPSSDEDADDEDAEAPKKRRHGRRDDEGADTGKSKVTFASEQPDVTFHVLTGEANGIVTMGGYWGAMHAESYRELCTAPCSVNLDHGPYKFGLSIEGRNPVKTEESVMIRGPKTVTGEYDSNRGVRIGGILVMVLGDAAGLGMMLGGLRAGPCDPTILALDGSCLHQPSVPLMVGGAVVAGVASIVGLVMLLQRDHAHITVSPGASAIAPRASAREALSLEQLKGLTLKAVF